MRSCSYGCRTSEDCDNRCQEAPGQGPFGYRSASSEIPLPGEIRVRVPDLLRLERDNERYRRALREIAMMDYRGNRPREQEIAQEALDHE